MARILVIDDEKESLTFTTEVLEREHEVITFDNWLIATDYILREHFDLILVDIVMPGLSGDKLVEILKKKVSHRQLNIVLFSGIDKDVLRHKAEEIGVIGYIHKPCAASLLSLRVKRFLNNLR